MYAVEYGPGVRAQVESLPADTMRAYVVALDAIRRDPWQGQPWEGHPREFRSWAFGAWGLLQYVISERTVRVLVVQVTWAG